MNITTSEEKIIQAIEQIDAMIDSCIKEENDFKTYLEKVHPQYLYSAKNLIHYLVYRNRNSGELQTLLFNHGLSGLKNAEGHVMSSLIATKHLLHKLIDHTAIEIKQHEHSVSSIKKSQKLIRQRSRELLGERSRKRSVRIMVTQAANAAKEPEVLHEMMQKGMNLIRINCAHETEIEWLGIIQHTRELSQKTGKQIRISMDLGGPKIRTGPIKTGPKVAHLSPDRDNMGHVINPSVAILLPEGELFPDEENTYIPVPKEMITLLNVGDTIWLHDTRDKKRFLKVAQKEEKLAWVHCYDSAYIQTGMELTIENNTKTFQIGEIPPLEEYLLLKKNDRLIIHKKQTVGEPAVYDRNGGIKKTAHISCTSSEVFDDGKAGQPIVFDDGKMSGIILESTGEELLVEITHAKEFGFKLKSDKGINFPSSELHLSGLTQKDREDLKFVARYADIVNMSFVNTQEDVEDLFKEIRLHGADNKIGVILKIETMTGFRNIVKILLTAMQMKPIGVMIARGDLAIECGWHNIGIVQEELLKICHAAHIPTVWATQVMENLAKKGIPSRAEITDAVMAQRADCVMLNKGMYVSEAIDLLDSILINLERTLKDKRAFFRQIEGISS